MINVGNFGDLSALIILLLLLKFFNRRLYMQVNHNRSVEWQILSMALTAHSIENREIPLKPVGQASLEWENQISMDAQIVR